MTTADPKTRTPGRRFLRRIVGGSLLAVLLFAGLWMTMFNATTSALVAFGLSGGMVTAGSTSDWLSGIVDFILEAVLSIFAAIGNFFTSFFDG